jgi:hypothetical protein
MNERKQMEETERARLEALGIQAPRCKHPERIEKTQTVVNKQRSEHREKAA